MNGEQPQQSLLSQAVQNETEGVPQADQGQQQIYNVFVKTAMLVSKKAKDGIAKRIHASTPVDGLANAVVQVIEKALEQLAKIGVEVPEDIIREGGMEIMELIHDEHGLNFTDEQAQQAVAEAMDIYLSHREQDGTLDTSGMEDMANMIKEGKLPPDPGRPGAQQAGQPEQEMPT